MEFRKQRGTAVSLVLAAHPVPALAMTVGVAAAAAASERRLVEVGLVAATVLSGQLTVGWLDDLLDRGRDGAVGRRDRPVAMGWVDPGTVSFSIAVVVLLVVPLSIANGTYAGLAHLGAVAALWLYHLWFKKGLLSWLPYTVAFGLLPAFLSYGGLGGGMHGGPPTWQMTTLAALLGFGIHVLASLGDLVPDHTNGLRHLPLRIALKTGAPRLLWLSVAYTLLVSAGIVVAGLTVGLRQ
jgi:4-hydroxybenzoate polyprenyltransferase